MENKKQIMVERDTYERNGKTYYSYYIKGTVRGREIRAGVMPPDTGGYRVLDIVFGNEMQAELTVKPFEIKDEKTRTSIKGNTYGVKSTDETGKVYECTIKPSRISDKALINMLLE